MSFTGDLDHLPIIDIVQLLHQTRKTGTLCLKSAKGESQLVFKDGYIVSANHHNNNIRIGRILTDMGAVTEESIESALHLQGAGEERKPLIAILIETGQIDRKTAYKGLETLIELTIVEVLTWNEGTFTLDISAEVVSDEYRYFPEKLHEDLILDTQNVLMDALRIYDERNRDGQQVEDDWLNDDEAFSLGETATDEVILEDALSAEDLGLDDLDTLDRKIPDVFIGLREDKEGTGPESVAVQEPRLLPLLQGRFNHIRTLTKAPDIAFDLLKLTASLLERSVTLVVHGSELVAERSFGIRGEHHHLPSPALKFRIPLNGAPSIFRDVIESGQFFYGQSSDKVLYEYLFREIGLPHTPHLLLAPLKCFGRTIALVYGDFGNTPPRNVETSLVDMATQFGSLVLDNAVYRSRQGSKVGS